MMMTAKNGTDWNVQGISITTSDAIYDILQKAIDSGNPDQHDLQMKTGHRAPIIIDTEKHVMQFQSW